MCFGKNGLFLEAVLVALLDRLQEHLHVLGYQMGWKGSAPHHFSHNSPSPEQNETHEAKKKKLRPTFSTVCSFFFSETPFVGVAWGTGRAAIRVIGVPAHGAASASGHRVFRMNEAGGDEEFASGLDKDLTVTKTSQVE
jgi:hypothetical protein